jgi:hypothetical protein
MVRERWTGKRKLGRFDIQFERVRLTKFNPIGMPLVSREIAGDKLLRIRFKSE